MRVSLYRGAKTVRPAGSCGLQEFIAAARGEGVSDGWDEHVRLVSYIRRTRDPDARNELKVQLTGATPSAVFEGRRQLHAPWSHSGAVCVDVDKTPTTAAAQRLREAAKGIPSCVGGFVSPGAKGVKLFLRVDPLPADPGGHTAACATAMAVVAEAFGSGVDPSCSDVTRLCYATVDAGAWSRPPDEAEAVEWDPSAAVTLPRRIGCGNLQVRHVIGGALAGDIAVGGVYIAVGTSPDTFHRLAPGGRHKGLVRGVRMDAWRGEDRRSEWLEAAVEHMGESRRREIEQCIRWGHDAGTSARERAEEQTDG